MIPVFQTIFTLPDGNCLTACIASILEMSLADVPAPPDPYQWQKFYLEWLRGRGLALIVTGYNIDAPVTDWPMLMPGWTILGVKSPRFAPALHAVVAFNGVIVHDPNPAYEGHFYLPTDIVDVAYFVPVSPEFVRRQWEAVHGSAGKHDPRREADLL